MRFLKEFTTMPVLGAVGLTPVVAQGSPVPTLSRVNQEAEMDLVSAHLPAALERLRSFSPVWPQKIAAMAGGQS